MKIAGVTDVPTINTNHLDKGESTKAPAPAVTEAKAPLDEQLSSKYAELAKREKILRSKIQSRELELKAREEALANKEKEYSTSYVPKGKISEMFQSDPYAFMRDHNIDGDTLTQTLLNQPSPQDRVIKQLQQEVAALKGIPEQTKSLFEEREKAQREQAINVIRSDVKNLVASDETFEIIKGTESEEEVVKKIETTLEDTGVILSAQEAAEAIEQELLEGFKKCAHLKKIQALFTPAVQEQTPKLPITPQAKTLAHAQVSSAQRPMSPRERAIALLEGKQI
jgi:hypothetical protein